MAFFHPCPSCGGDHLGCPYFLGMYPIPVATISHLLQHPSFEHPYYVIHQPPYEVSGEGWGFFTISIVVGLKPGYSWVSPNATLGPGGQSLLPLYWTLDFERELSYRQVEVGVAV